MRPETLSPQVTIPMIRRSAWILFLCGALQAGGAEAPLGLWTSPEGVLMRGEKPYRGIGVNFFDCFSRTLKDPADTSYREGFRRLGEHGIPFARFQCCGHWPADWRLYFRDREAYFRQMDGVVKAAEESNVGLIPSLFWRLSTVPDLVGEPCNRWGDPQSRTHAFMRTYIREVVGRYLDSPAIWGWEFGNEYNLAVDLPEPDKHRPQAAPALGTPRARTKADELTRPLLVVALGEFGKAVRAIDRRRVLSSGNSIERDSAWHNAHESNWKRDSRAQFQEIFLADQPAPLDLLSLHIYPHSVGTYFADEKVEIIRACRQMAGAAHRPLYVGEFGSVNPKKEVERRDFDFLLQAIVDSGVPLASLWVYDFDGQKESTVTFQNDRAWMLQAIADANKLFAKPSPLRD